MNYEEKYKEALEKAKDMLSYKEVRQEDMEYLFPELAESEDERIRKKLICFVENWKNFSPNSPFDDYAVYTSDRDECDKILAWLEKQGEQKTDPCTDCTNVKGCVTCEHGELRETHTRTLNPDKVIEWMRVKAPKWLYDTVYPIRLDVDAEDLIEQFKKDFDL